MPITKIGSSLFCIFIIPNGNETPPTPKTALFCLRYLRRRAFSTHDSPIPANKTWSFVSWPPSQSLKQALGVPHWRKPHSDMYSLTSTLAFILQDLNPPEGMTGTHRAAGSKSPAAA